MNVGEVMAEIAAAADEMEGLRCFAYPISEASPPTFWVDLPERISFDLTYDRGVDQIELYGYLVVGQNLDRVQSAKLAAYMSSAGAASVKQAVEAVEYEACDDVSVTVAEFQRISVAATEYLGCRFTIVATGSGA
ncbi:hypothetical protein [Actinosynnema sp. ALI-1.44]|uniref:hypothetical protein n=1 Tax=Actinosynnema sp. ALI-1.44 TaxID=1933779 RepID=UPI0011779C4D|nr:hypothetical protein [Actinosynnema sp. ALI-1.44]